MRIRINHTLNMLKSVACFIQQFPATLQNSVIAELYTRILTTIAAIETAAREQVDGRGNAAGGVQTKRAKQEELRAYLKDVARVGRTLDSELHPGLAQHFVLPNSRGYAALVASARAMIAKATEHEAAFVARGFSVTFLADLNHLLEDFHAAVNAKIDGMQTQVGGTSALHHQAARGIKAAQELDAIFRALFRNDPVILDVWKHARHIQKDSVRATTESPASTLESDPLPARTSPDVANTATDARVQPPEGGRLFAITAPREQEPSSSVAEMVSLNLRQVEAMLCRHCIDNGQRATRQMKRHWG